MVNTSILDQKTVVKVAIFLSSRNLCDNFSNTENFVSQEQFNSNNKTTNEIIVYNLDLKSRKMINKERITNFPSSIDLFTEWLYKQGIRNLIIDFIDNILYQQCKQFNIKIHIGDTLYNPDILIENYVHEQGKAILF